MLQRTAAEHFDEHRPEGEEVGGGAEVGRLEALLRRDARQEAAALGGSETR